MPGHACREPLDGLKDLADGQEVERHENQRQLGCAGLRGLRPLRDPDAAEPDTPGVPWSAQLLPRHFRTNDCTDSMPAVFHSG